MNSNLNNANSFYTIKWPTARTHQTKSLSGVLVETNAQRQVALHFWFFGNLRERPQDIVVGCW